MSKKLFLLDGMALVYRAHFALIGKPIYTSRGVNSSALYVFTNTLLDILNNQRPTHIAVAFDTDAPTQRHKDFADYKIQREAMPKISARRCRTCAACSKGLIFRCSSAMVTKRTTSSAATFPFREDWVLCPATRFLLGSPDFGHDFVPPGRWGLRRRLEGADKFPVANNLERLSSGDLVKDGAGLVVELPCVKY